MGAVEDEMWCNWRGVEEFENFGEVQGGGTLEGIGVVVVGCSTPPR